MDHSLLELEKDYYLGNYQSCINKANSMPSQTVANFYMCLSYFQLKKYDILEHELVKNNNELCINLIGLLLAFTRDVEESSERDAIMRKLESKVDLCLDAESKLVILSIYVQEKMYADALKVFKKHTFGGETLSIMLAEIGVYLLMNRTDLAENLLKKMQAKDDYATLTMLATAQVKLATGNPREAYDIAKELEDKYKATPLLSNIQTAAAICMGQMDVAKLHCEVALDLDNDNPEAMINMIHILSKSKSSPEVKKRHHERLVALYPKHDFVKELGRMKVELVQ